MEQESQAEWYTRRDMGSAEKGPFTAEAVSEALRGGAIGPRTLVRRSGSQTWVLLGDHLAFKDKGSLHFHSPGMRHALGGVLPEIRHALIVVRSCTRQLIFVLVTRTVHGPARIVFEAWTKPELFKRCGLLVDGHAPRHARHSLRRRGPPGPAPFPLASGPPKAVTGATGSGTINQLSDSGKALAGGTVTRRS